MISKRSRKPRDLYLKVLLFGLGTVAAAAPCPQLESWLETHLNIASSLVWEDEFGARPWPLWTPRSRASLARLFAKACSISPETYGEGTLGLPTVLPNQKTLRDRDVGKTVLSPGVAEAMYRASVAHALVLEVDGRLPWSVRGMTSGQLSVLFDSRHFFRWDSAERGYSLNVEWNGLVSHSPPERVYGFLRRENLIGQNKRDSILRWLRWTGRLTHDVLTEGLIREGFRRDSARVFEGLWGFRGFPPVMTVLEGSKQRLDPSLPSERRHWTAGCWGTSGLFKSVLRAINLPVVIEQSEEHALPAFPTEGMALSHGDDPYDLLFTTLPEPRPVERLLRASGPPSKPGQGPADIAVEYVPSVLVHMHCSDRRRGIDRSRGEVLAVMGAYFSLVDLERTKLWERLEKAIRRDGCPGERGSTPQRAR